MYFLYFFYLLSISKLRGLDVQLLALRCSHIRSNETGKFEADILEDPPKTSRGYV